MKVKVIPIVTGALGTIPNVLVKRLEDLEIREQVETLQKTPLLRSVRILRRVLETKRRFAVTQTPVKSHLVTLMRITLRSKIIIFFYL